MNIDCLDIYWDMSPNDILKMTDTVIKQSFINNNNIATYEIKSDKDVINFLKLINNDAIYFENFYSVCAFLQFVSPDDKIRKASFTADLSLSKHINELNLRKDIYDKLIFVQKYCKNKKILQDIDDKFINKLIITYERNGINLDKKNLSLLLKVKNEISNFENNMVTYIAKLENDKLELNTKDTNGIPANILNSFEKYNDGYKIKMNKNNYNLCMKYIINSDTRKKIESYYSNRHNNLVDDICKYAVLKDKHAKLLSYKSSSDYKSAIQMTKNSDNIKRFLTELLIKLDNRYKKEIDTIQKIAKKFGHNGQLTSWDMSYYINKWKQEYGINDQIIKQYFEINATIDKIFKIYESLFDIKFSKLKNVKTWHKNVVAYKITKSNDLLGYLYLDLFSRDGKYKQTRCFSLQSGCQNIPVMALVSSLEIKEDATLLYFQDVVSIFHEISHVIHHLFSKSKYIVFSGINVEYDFIETPAQMLDLLCWEPIIIKRLSAHYKTKESLSDQIVNKIMKLKNIDLGVFYKKNILIALFDQMVHSNNNFIQSCEEFLKNGQSYQLKSLLFNIYKQLHNEIMIYSNNPENNNYHIQLNDDLVLPYEWINFLINIDSQYYCSIWSRILSSDMYNEKIKNKPLDKHIGTEIVECILKHGGSKPAYDMICNYMKRKPSIDAFVSMHDLELDVEYSFFLRTDDIKNSINTIYYKINTPRTIINHNIEYDKKNSHSNHNNNNIQQYPDDDDDINSISNNFTEINESELDTHSNVLLLQNKFSKYI